MIKLLQDGYSMLFYLFIAVIVFGSSKSKELEEDYTPIANNETTHIRTVDVNSRSELTTESNNEWGSIADPSY